MNDEFMGGSSSRRAMSDVQKGETATHENELAAMIFGSVVQECEGQGPETDLFEAGLDSMGMMQLIILLEENFGVPIPASEVTRANFSSIRALSQLMMRLSTGSGH